jgi:hypothetical protein
VGAGELSPQADVVHAGVVPKGDGSAGVDDVASDAVVVGDDRSVRGGLGPGPVARIFSSEGDPRGSRK